MTPETDVGCEQAIFEDAWYSVEGIPLEGQSVGGDLGGLIQFAYSFLNANSKQFARFDERITMQGSVPIIPYMF